MNDYDKRMDALAKAIVTAAQGKPVHEVVFACGAVIAHCLQQLPPDVRNEVWAKTLTLVAERKDKPIQGPQP